MSDVAISGPGFSAFVREKPERTVDLAAGRKMLRKRLFMAFGALLVLAAAGFGTRWWFVSQRFISTDDAYVAADSAQVTPQISATIMSFHRKPLSRTRNAKRFTERDFK